MGNDVSGHLSIIVCNWYSTPLEAMRQEACHRSVQRKTVSYGLVRSQTVVDVQTLWDDCIRNGASWWSKTKKVVGLRLAMRLADLGVFGLT